MSTVAAPAVITSPTTAFSRLRIVRRGVQGQGAVDMAIRMDAGDDARKDEESGW